MLFRVGTLILIALALCASLSASTILFTLLGPTPNYTFTRTDTPSAHDPGTNITVPAGPYAGWLGANIPADQYAFLCIDYLKTSYWNTTYSGTEYGVGDLVPNHTAAQLVEAAYLASKLYSLGGGNASLYLYQGPISMAVWQIMDPTIGDVPRDAAAQPYVLEAQNAYNTGRVTAATYPLTKIFVPDTTSAQDFMTVTPGVPEPATIGMVIGGLVLIGLGRWRRPKPVPGPVRDRQ